MLSSARTATRSLGWLGGRYGKNSLIRGSVVAMNNTPITMRRFQKNSTDAAAESGNKQVPKSAMDGGRERGGKKNQENMGGKPTDEKRRFITSERRFIVYAAALSSIFTVFLTSVMSWKMQDQRIIDESAAAKFKRTVEIFKEKISCKFKGALRSLLPTLDNGKLEYLKETCYGMDETIKNLQARGPVCTCIEGDTSIGKTTTLKRGLQGLNNVLYITMKARTDSPESVMCAALGVEPKDDWRDVLKVSAEEVRDAGFPCIIVVVDDVNAAFKSHSEEMSSILAFLMQCTDESLISLVILGSEPVKPFVDKAETSGRSRLEYVNVRPSPKFVDELDDRLNWGEKLGEPLCGAVKTSLGPHMVSLSKVSALTIAYDKEVKKDPTKQDQAKAQLQEKVRLAVVGVLKGHLATLGSVLTEKKLEDKAKVTEEPASEREEPASERALLIKMLESDDGVFIVSIYDDLSLRIACKPLCDANLVRRELDGDNAVYRFAQVGVEVMAREQARRGKVLSAESPALASERAKKQFDALKVIGFK